MFNKKSKEIKELKSKLQKLNRKLYDTQIEQYDDFISILTQIQDFNNEKGQWKHKQLTINNAINLALENYKDKKTLLEIDRENY